MNTIPITECSSGFILGTASFFLERKRNVVAPMRTLASYSPSMERIGLTSRIRRKLIGMSHSYQRPRCLPFCCLQHWRSLQPVRLCL